MIKMFQFGLLELEATSVRGRIEVFVLSGCLERVRFCCAALQLYGHLYSTRPSVPTSPSELQARQWVLESITRPDGCTETSFPEDRRCWRYALLTSLSCVLLQQRLRLSMLLLYNSVLTKFPTGVVGHLLDTHPKLDAVSHSLH